MSLNVFEYYKEQNKNPVYVDEYQSTGDGKSGKTFWNVNTNFRTIFTFISNFHKFAKYDKKDRKTWEVYANNSEQKAKQYTVRFQQSKLFKLNKNKYELTAKGEAFGDLVNMIEDPSMNIGENEQWVIIYYFLLNSYFNLKPNYLLKRSQEIYEILKTNGIDYNSIKQNLESFLKKSKSFTKDNFFFEDSFWILTFCKDKDFLSLYANGNKEDKEKLKKYVTAEAKKPNKSDTPEYNKSKDLIGHKFAEQGQYTISTFVDEMKILYVTNEILLLENKDPLSLANNICNIYNRISHVDYHKIESFINLHYDIFEIIFNEAILNKNIDTELNDNTIIEIDNSEIQPIDQKVDDTTTKTTTVLRHTSQILKRMTKDRANNKCELDNINSCIYFTAKENNKNYLEIHHLIPFEFSNDFANSLEVLDNYIALCPHCHRLLHFGVDRERKGALTFLYNQRIDGLRKKGLDISLKQLLAYYGFDE